MSINKEGYFKHRTASLAARTDRDALGEREVVTLITMLNTDAGEHFLNGKAVVDLGCGDQHLKKALQTRGASYRGIDIDECNLEVNSFPLENDCYDVAICLALIEHLRDPGHFLNETKRILRPGGVLWLSTPDIQACGYAFWNDPTHVHPYTRSSFKMLLQMNGFSDVLVTPNYRCKPSHYYRDTDFHFFRARRLMPFAGTSRLPIPELFKGQCTGLFALARKPLSDAVA